MHSVNKITVQARSEPYTTAISVDVHQHFRLHELMLLATKIQAQQ